MVNDRYPLSGVALFSDESTVDLVWAHATSFMQRFCGLMLKRDLPENAGLLFEHCRSIHMMFMRIPLDVLWLIPESNPQEDKKIFRVARLDANLQPWRFASAPRNASAVIEFPQGTFDCTPEQLILRMQ